jgi:hypothetical protein
MTNEEKAKQYQQMMFQYDLLSNQINQIKGSSFELDNKQIVEIRKLQNHQDQIMNSVQKLLAM